MKKLSVIIAATVVAGLTYTAQANAIVGSLSVALTGWTANGSGIGHLSPNPPGGDGSSFQVSNLAGYVSSATGGFSSVPSFPSFPIPNFATFTSPITVYDIPTGDPEISNSGLLFSVGNLAGDVFKFYELAQTGSTGSSVVGNPSSATWQITGRGYVEEFDAGNHLINGGMNDIGTWSLGLTFTDPATANGSATAGFNFVPLPDGGVTVSLLGGALIALGAFRRKLSV